MARRRAGPQAPVRSVTDVRPGRSAIAHPMRKTIMSLEFDSMMHVLRPLHPAAAPVVAFLKERLGAAIQGADPDVRAVFFRDSAAPYADHESDAASAELRSLAVKYASFLVSTVPDLAF